MMLFSDAICFALLTITVTATCVQADHAQQDLADRTPEKRTKRESAVLIDSYPTMAFKPRPEIMIKRVSKTKHRKPRPKYAPHKIRKPLKPIKYMRSHVRPTKPNKRVPKPKYGRKKPHYGPPKHVRYPHYAPEPVGFGEPPKDVTQEYLHPQTYGEPPVDSYGDPLKPSIANLPTAESFAESNYNLFGQQHQSYQSYQQDLNVDNVGSNTKMHPIYIATHADHLPHQHEDFLDTYEDVYKHGLVKESYKKRKNKPYQRGVENGWKKGKIQEDDHIVVGGQYAEPPGRLVPNFQPSAPMHGADEFSPLAYLDSEVAASATISPYVNYKHSNMAFSPQNLNDAFSILD